MKKIISILVALSITAFGYINVYSNEQQIDTVTVAVCADYQPFEYYEDGILQGFDIELILYVCSQAGYMVDFVNMPFDELVSSVQTGKTDCAISTFTYTTERDEAVDYTTFYLNKHISDNQVEKYGIIFKQGLNNAYYKFPIYNAGGHNPQRIETVYMTIDSGIKNAIKNGTVEKLMKKYNLNHGADKYCIPEVEDNKSYNDRFEDGLIGIPSDWAKESVQYGYELEIVKENLQFTKPISREAFCELIYNLIIKVNGMLAAPMADNFTDVTNERILMLAGAGIINGKSETEFCPGDNLTRAEAATIIVRMINKYMPMETTMMWYEFDDGEDIADWASDSVQTVCNLGFMNGVGDNKFAPDIAYTAEQAVATLVRVYGRAKELGLLGNSINAGVIGGMDGIVPIPEG